MDPETVVVKGTKPHFPHFFPLVHRRKIRYHFIRLLHTQTTNNVQLAQQSQLWCLSCILCFLQPLRVQLSNPSCTRCPAAGDRQHTAYNKRVGPRKDRDSPQGGMIKRFCLPLAATPSSFSTSDSSNFPRASTNPVKLASMREGVTDFGRATHPFLSARSQKSKPLCVNILFHK